MTGEPAAPSAIFSDDQVLSLSFDYEFHNVSVSFDGRDVPNRKDCDVGKRIEAASPVGDGGRPLCWE
jgi:hypothetical protein